MSEKPYFKSNREASDEIPLTSASRESRGQAGNLRSPELQLLEPGDHPVNVPIVCVITRFCLRHPYHLVFSYLDYRRVLSEARRSKTPGLLRTAFLVENPTTWYSLSVWASPDAIPRFGTTVPIHVTAANRVFGRLAFDKGHRPEVWSTKWRLVSVSNNLSWKDFDLRRVIADLGGLFE